MLHEMVAILAALRRTPPPRIPLHVLSAFDRCVAAGSYFTKYPASGGSPHERFFALRVITNEHFQPEPLFLWSTHDRSWTSKGRYHLAHLTGLATGALDYAGFAKYVTADGERIRGPISNAERIELPARLSMVVQFNTPELHSMGLLCVDEDVFQCWNIVLSFIVDINTGFLDSQDAVMGGGGEAQQQQ